MRSHKLNTQLSFEDHKDFIVIDKPEGLTTHRSTESDLGIQEFYQNQIGQELFVVHRLDKETSGVLIFAKTSPAAEKLSALFKNREIQKEYLFLTDQKASFQETTYSSLIENKKASNSKLTSDSSSPPANSTTHFTFIQKQGNYFLWMAKPVTGKSHQIRRHAKDLGISILGDSLYAGSPWHRLALNAQKISFEWNQAQHSSESRAPWWSKSGAFPLDESTNEDLGFVQAYRSALEKRLRSYSQIPQTFRLLNDEHPDLTWDHYQNNDWISWYKESPPTQAQQEKILTLLQERNQKGFIRWMKNRGADPIHNSLWPLQSPGPVWTAEENSVVYEIRSNTGLSPGLFLDQRQNRKWVLENSANKDVLNLFSYTCGFSLCAAIGQAKSVVSNDVSQQFLDWGKKNFTLNQLDPAKYEFFKQDVFLFLKGTSNRARKFDLIIADPPSFGRSDRGVFQFKKDWPQLLKDCLSVLKPKGQILFSCNYEGWDLSEFNQEISKWCLKNKCKTSPLSLPDLDYEHSTIDRKMKCILIETKNN